MLKILTTFWECPEIGSVGYRLLHSSSAAEGSQRESPTLFPELEQVTVFCDAKTLALHSHANYLTYSIPCRYALDPSIVKPRFRFEENNVKFESLGSENVLLPDIFRFPPKCQTSSLALARHHMCVKSTYRGSAPPLAVLTLAAPWLIVCPEKKKTLCACRGLVPQVFLFFFSSFFCQSTLRMSPIKKVHLQFKTTNFQPQQKSRVLAGGNSARETNCFYKTGREKKKEKKKNPQT